MPAILTNPPAIAFSKNPVWLKITSADYQAAAPQLAVNYQEFDGVINAGDTLVLNWTANQVTMTAATVPDGSGNQFLPGPGDEAYVTSLVDVFQGNYFIDLFFIVSTNFSGAHPRLIFTARNYGADYSFTAGLTSGNITPGADNTPQANFMHHIEIWIANLDGGYDQALDANIPLDEPLTGTTTFDISGVLDSWLSQPDEYDMPVMTSPFAQCIKSLRAYFIKYAQFMGETPAIQKVSKSDLFYCALGGLGQQPSLLRNLITELCPVALDPSQNRFMRQGSKTKLVTQKQPEWLTFINVSGGVLTVNFEVSIFNDDNTSFVFNAVEALEIGLYQKFQFQAGFGQLNIAGRQDASKNPVYYSCRVSQGGAYLTDIYSFAIDYKYRTWPRYFVYENSYGAYQTIATVGKGQLQYDRTKTDAQRTLDRTAAAAEGDFIETNIFIQEKGIISMGFDRVNERITALLRDFVLSRHIFLYIPASETFVPIGISSTNIKDAPDGTNVYANNIEFFIKYQEKVWTEDQSAVTDDDLAELIARAGSAIPANVPGEVTNGGYIVAEFGDTHLSVAAGLQAYTAPFWLTGKTGYRIYSTQLERYLFADEVAYNSGGFTIQIPGFSLQAGDQLIIWPFILNDQVVNGGFVTCQFGDIHLSVVGGQQVYSSPYWLTGKNNYRIFSTQLNRYFYTNEIGYNIGGFTIQIPGFLLQEGDQLIIWPFILNPDS